MKLVYQKFTNHYLVQKLYERSWWYNYSNNKQTKNNTPLHKNFRLQTKNDRKQKTNYINREFH